MACQPSQARHHTLPDVRRRVLRWTGGHAQRQGQHEHDGQGEGRAIRRERQRRARHEQRGADRRADKLVTDDFAGDQPSVGALEQSLWHQAGKCCLCGSVAHGLADTEQEAGQ